MAVALSLHSGCYSLRPSGYVNHLNLYFPSSTVPSSGEDDFYGCPNDGRTAIIVGILSAFVAAFLTSISFTIISLIICKYCPRMCKKARVEEEFSQHRCGGSNLGAEDGVAGRRNTAGSFSDTDVYLSASEINAPMSSNGRQDWGGGSNGEDPDYEDVRNVITSDVYMEVLEEDSHDAQSDFNYIQNVSYIPAQPPLPPQRNTLDS